MGDRLFVGVLGHRNSGKSRTWNTLFGKTVRTGTRRRWLCLRENEWVEVFLVSGSPEERGKYAGGIIKGKKSRIVLCSMQYAAEVSRTLEYVTAANFDVYVQWLNPGYHDRGVYFDELGLASRLLSAEGVLAMRSGKGSPKSRVQEISEFIYGWAKYRDLVVSG